MALRDSRPASLEPTLCSIRNLDVIFPTRSGCVQAVRDFNLDIYPGEAVGIVGESGSGKSMAALAMLNLVPFPGTVSGQVLVGNRNVLSLASAELTRIRGRWIGLIMQDPTPSLNPVRTVQSQLHESARLAGISPTDVRRTMHHGLEEVQLDPREVLLKYPFELSGGMNQRVAIAMALIQSPRILIADEPTTALDVTTQASILTLLDSLRRRRQMALILISHDLTVVHQVATRVCVMYGGRIVEQADIRTIVRGPVHPYTQALVASIPTLRKRGQDPQGIPGQLGRIMTDEAGCPFVPRCTYARDSCKNDFPTMANLGEDHVVWCWHVDASVSQIEG
jgi:oligopeptide/dipeptide ABC transporter ATP-binding protein